MELTTEIVVRKNTNPRIGAVDFDNLQFGTELADHMLVCDYHDGNWHHPHIVPFSNLSLSPATLALHYGQTVFEGMKAFPMVDGRTSIFRVEKHYERLEKSLSRMCMAVPPKDIFIEGLRKLVETDKDWVPKTPGSALYIRPMVIATEEFFGVRVSSEYRFIIFTAPVPAFFSKPIKLKAETKYIRAAKGGTGYTKCGGNYGGAFYPTQMAKEQGYDQLLWTDAATNKFVEESGMMNIMFVINGTLVTPALSDTILDGVTRDSLLVLARDMGVTTEVRPVSLEELEHAFKNNLVSEAFGAGTAAVVAPVSTININEVDFQLPGIIENSISSKLKEKLENMRAGVEEDVHKWNCIV